MKDVAILRALPRSFWLMMASVLFFGLLAGDKVLPVFLLTTPVLAWVLLRAEVRETKHAIANAELGLDALSTDAAAAVTAALGVLEPGAVRDLLLRVVQVGGNARRHLPESYAASDFGQSIEDLVIAGAETAVHAQSFDRTLHTLEAQPQDAQDFGWRDAVRKVTEARDTRIRQLTVALHALSGIGPDIAEAGDAGTTRILEALDSLKREVREHEAAEAEIQALLE